MPDLFVTMLKVHQEIYERSGGFLGHRLLFGMPTLLLHTVGRKSGEPRTSALTYGKDGDEFLVVASKGGSPRPPAWWHNLHADPNVVAQIGLDQAQRRRTLSPAWRRRLRPDVGENEQDQPRSVRRVPEENEPPDRDRRS
jgi:deazaflavin-dependent oxidoreductase (nitroreductase family)